MATVEKSANGDWFEVRLPSGEYWTMDAYDDWDESYARDAIEAWTAWLDYITGKPRPEWVKD